MPRWSPAGLHCYVTGGSQGLGLEVARQLVKGGAHVSIVARDQAKLDAALRVLEESRVNDEQVLRSYSFSLDSGEGAQAALNAASAAHGGRVPDAFFLCAGSARPGFFVEETPESLTRAFDNVYWVQALSAHAAARAYAKQRVKNGKIVFVSSLLGFTGLIGYASYAPAKHALRGLADSLRSELALYTTGVHIYFPPAMNSPGYDEENRTKPAITLKIEEGDGSPLTCEQAARGLLAGVSRGYAHISADFQNDVFRSSMRGATPYNNIIWDVIHSCIGSIGLVQWRQSVDKLVAAHRAEHEKYLQQKGFWNE